MTLRNKNRCLIVDFHYRNWLFLLFYHLVALFFDLHQLTAVVQCQPITASSTAISFHPANHRHLSQSPSSSSTSTSICSSLRDNFRFDFALNQHIAERHSAHFRHYLMAKRKLLRFTLPTEDVQLTPLVLANQSLLDAGPDFDLAFSLLGEVEGVTKLCLFKLRPGTLRCLQLDQYQDRPLTDPATFRDPILPEKRFSLAADFLPTVAFQDVRFTDYPASRHQIIFVEQTLLKREQDGGGGENSLIKRSRRKFHRRIETYLFDFKAVADELFLRTTNLTASSVLPDYLELMPSSLELTGVFNWKRGGGQDHEYLLLAFNGSHHLYCLNSDCAREERYQPWLVDCRPSQEVLKQEIKHPEQDYLWAINHHPKYEAVAGKGPSLIEYVSEGLITAKSNRPYSLYLLSGMVFLVVCLGLLVLGVCYYSVKEVHLQERQAKAVYEKAILLSAISSAKRKLEEEEEEEGGQKEEGLDSSGDNCHQETTVSGCSSSFATSHSSDSFYSNSVLSTPEAVPHPSILPPTPPPESEMVRIPLEAVLVNGGGPNGVVATTTTDSSVNSSASPAMVLQSFSSAV